MKGITDYGLPPVAPLLKTSPSSSIGDIYCLKARKASSVLFEIGNIATTTQPFYEALRQKDANLVGTYLPVR